MRWRDLARLVIGYLAGWFSFVQGKGDDVTPVLGVGNAFNGLVTDLAGSFERTGSQGVTFQCR